ARPGDEVICETGAHFLHFEGGSVAAHLGLMMRPVPGVRGTLQPEDVERLIRPGNEHNPRSAVVAIENTHNSAGGAVFPIETARAIANLCRERGVKVHLDGARLFNAQVATGTPAAEWAACADTVTFCFSKGLGAPIGSMVCSTADAIAEGRRVRKRMGGGMRQVGVIAAAARVALDTGIERLAEDHANATRLAQGLADLDSACVDLASVETNMVYVDLSPWRLLAPDVAERLRTEGVLTLGFPGSSMRLVTHRDVDIADIDRTLLAFKKVLLA
ncbi:MAG TPA: GntG family PLP-dependent aldolase, partial [Actinomycetota bacterium]|nr:GntG family PLP-dependent aldolase [Actinomycetota bacterium]